MNKIPCRYYLEYTNELADFCIAFDNNFSPRAFYLNACLSIELLLKNLIIFEEYNKIKDSVNEEEYKCFLENIKKRLASYNHKLTDLFNFDIDLKKEIGLVSINRSINDFSNQFQIKLKNYVVLIPTLEAVRYNVFAGNQQVVENNDISNVKKLIEEIKQYVNNKVKYS